MHFTRTIFPVLTAVLFVGCASKRKSGHCCEDYKPPEFQLSLLLGSVEEGTFTIELFEDPKEVSLRVDRTEPKYSVSNLSKYRSLKDAILSSSTWENGASQEPGLAVFTGPPRDIMIIRSEKFNITLQGPDVPKGWKDGVLELAYDAINSD